MHYFIDGYNLLFRVVPDSHDDLQNYRQSLIEDLNTKIRLLQWDVSIVFDANFQMGERTRSHYDGLEILFTGEGETADEYILEEIKNTPFPHKETVVTSDKKLAWRVKNRLAHIESVEEFIVRLNRSYKNKKGQLKKGAKKPSFISSPVPTPQPHIPPKEASLESCADYYQEAFESKWKEISQEEMNKKQETKEKKLQSSQSPKRNPTKKSRSGFSDTDKDKDKDKDEYGMTETERWLKIFEKRPPID